MTVRKYFIGDIYPTNCGVDVQILEVMGLGKQNALIKWLDSVGYEQVVSTTNLNNGKLYNPYKPSVYGIGYVGIGKHVPLSSGVHTLEYSTWKGLYNRAYSEKFLIKKPTYRGCSVDSQWECFQDFGDWAGSAVGWGNTMWNIDKDLLFKGNKVYGPDTCVMLPHDLNMLIVSRIGGRGEYPIGVYWDKERSRYKGQYREFNGTGKSQRFDDVEEAFIYYKTNKERVIKEAAEIYKDKIDTRAYQALLSWEISIDD